MLSRNEITQLENEYKSKDIFGFQSVFNDWRELKSENESLKSTDKKLRESIQMHQQLNNELKKEIEKLKAVVEAAKDLVKEYLEKDFLIDNIDALEKALEQLEENK